MRSKKQPKGKPRTLRLSAETATAVDDMMQFIESVTRGQLWDSPHAKNSALNHIIQKMCEAVVNYSPTEETPNGVSVVDRESGRVLFTWPLAFDARAESEEEISMRLMLRMMSEEPFPT